MDIIGWYIATLHQMFGHDTAAAFIGAWPGLKGDCVICQYEQQPGEERRQAVIDALARPADPTRTPMLLWPALVKGGTRACLNPKEGRRVMPDLIPAAAAPCQCHQSFAAVAPTHPGHCCFLPATQDCHPAEFAEWERQKALRHPRTETSR